MQWFLAVVNKDDWLRKVWHLKRLFFQNLMIHCYDNCTAICTLEKWNIELIKILSRPENEMYWENIRQQWGRYSVQYNFIYIAFPTILIVYGRKKTYEDTLSRTGFIEGVALLLMTSWVRGGQEVNKHSFLIKDLHIGDTINFETLQSSDYHTNIISFFLHWGAINSNIE